MLSTTPARLAASGDARWARLRPFGWTVLLGAAVYGVLAPVLAITHELIVLGSAHLIGDLRICKGITVTPGGSLTPYVSAR